MSVTLTPNETIKIGVEIAKKLTGSDIILLSGNLGAGKTTLTKGILSYFGIDKNSVVSPTFTIMQSYTVANINIKTIVHIDTYRLESEEELKNIGVEDYLGEAHTLCIIEWPEKISSLLKNKTTKTINLATGENLEQRIIDFNF